MLILMIRIEIYLVYYLTLGTDLCLILKRFPHYTDYINIHLNIASLSLVSCAYQVFNSKYFRQHGVSLFYVFVLVLCQSKMKGHEGVTLGYKN